MILGWITLGLVGTLLAYWVWRQSQLSSGPTEFAFPTKNVTVDGLDVCYYELGQGRPLLLIHGLGASGYCFRHLAALLSAEFRVITIDLPGFGRSQKNVGVSYEISEQARRLTLFLDQLGVQQVALVGSSMGGLIALELAHTYPQRVSFVVTISPALRLPVWIPSLGMVVGRKFARRALNVRMMTFLLRRIVTDHSLIDEQMVHNYLQPLNEPGAMDIVFLSLRAIKSRLKSLKRMPLQVPSLVLWGRFDHVLSCPHQQHIRRVLPNAVFDIHEAGGHHLQEDHPVWVAERIQQFAEQRS